MNILVLHGPNLNLLGERPGDDKGRTLEQLDTLIRSKATAYGVDVRIFQSNHEGVLVDTLHAERRWADGIIINPGALTHTSYVLRDALAAVAKPALEVHLTDIRRRESWRRKSVIKDVCKGQVLGKGFESYVIALARFANDDLAGKKRTTGKAVASKATPRKAAAAQRTVPPPLVRHSLSRALVRQKIAERLSGKLSTAGLATWARTQWLEVRRGAPAESGHRELLEESLQSLTLSAMPDTRMNDEQLVELMSSLGE